VLIGLKGLKALSEVLRAALRTLLDDVSQWLCFRLKRLGFSPSIRTDSLDMLKNLASFRHFYICAELA
jgi:hypothetical protein